MKNNQELFIEELTLVKTDKYRELLRGEKLLISIQEGKDYNWLQEAYREVDELIEAMIVVDFNKDSEGDETC